MTILTEPYITMILKSLKVFFYETVCNANNCWWQLLDQINSELDEFFVGRDLSVSHKYQVETAVCSATTGTR